MHEPLAVEEAPLAPPTRRELARLAASLTTIDAFCRSRQLDDVAEGIGAALDTLERHMVEQGPPDRP